jgi:hypothetical protein
MYQILGGIPIRTRISGFGGLASACALTVRVLANCGSKNGTGAASGMEQTKAIAEEGFIYGLPMVMNYAVMNE